MNVVIIGGGRGSWKIRGIELGGALGARVVAIPSDDDMRWADVVVLVKRASPDWAALAHRFRKPVVWDALDFWEQERGTQNSLGEHEARALLQSWIARYQPALVIGATEAMAEAANGVYLAHHSRPGLSPAPARTVVKTVGYEGTRKFLGKWGREVQQECDRRGWAFVINPADLRDVDIVVAFRDGVHDGWMCREWKSGVKLVNAVAAGRPVICQATAAEREIKPSGSAIAEPMELAAALDFWMSYEYRRVCTMPTRTSVFCVAADYTLQAMAERYRQILQNVAKAKAA